MTEATLILLCVAVLGYLVPRPLQAARWVDRAPRLGIALWLGLDLAFVAFLLAASLHAAVSLPPINHSVAHLMDACLRIFHGTYQLVWWSTAVGVVGALCTLCVPAWVVTRMTVELRRAGRARRAHLQSLGLVARDDDDLLVVEHDQPVLYCVPGGRPAVIASRGALDALSPEQLAAAVEHERGHLRGRHHLLIGLANGFAAALPAPLSRHAARSVARLCELAADDYAARRHGTYVLAEAVVTVALGRAPAVGLGAGGDVVNRVERLTAHPVRLAGIARMIALGLLGLALAVPVGAAGVALGGTVADDGCPSALSR
ncbi:M56 family metallopeptidase [Hamadaea tsunoensis]|uniref:M56 family metallopeptidase n=1 Tax=Hamadaea tsunoensis TaxID=53368 RepID=UPI000423771A|nr:M56 family metallopeptidase [Hamadaea tsunoensis]